MKYLFYPLAFCLLLFSCNPDIGTRQEINQTVTIAGKVLNNAEFPDEYLIRFIVDDLSQEAPRYHNAILEDDGTFNIEFPKRFPQDIYMKFGNQLVTLFVHPGDSLYVEFDADEFINPSSENRHLTNSLKFSGAASKINTEITDFLPELYGQRNSRSYNDTVKAYTQKKFKEFILKRRERGHQLLSTYISRNDPSEEFVDWATYYIDYDAAGELLRYTWFHAMQNNIMPPAPDLSDEYFDFLEYIPLENQPASICSQYKSYLHEYFIIKLREVRTKNMNVFRRNNRDRYAEAKLIANYFISNSYGFHQEVILTQIFSSLLDYGKDLTEYEKLYTDYEKYIVDNRLKQTLVDKYTTNKLKAYDAYDSGYILSGRQSSVYNYEDILSKVVSNNIGKVIYIDFWATWCGPCITEFPYSKQLKKEYENKDITFVYFCVNSSRDMWEDIIREYKIQGQHYLLNSSQYGQISEIFQVSGIPHYALINSTGKIVSRKAPKPSSDEIRDELNKLLEK